MKPEYQDYYYLHRETLEQMRRDAIESIPCQRSHRKMVYECECGATITCKNLVLHFVSLKHREVCGDLE